MNNPSDLEIQAFLAAIESHQAAQAMLPNLLAASILAPLTAFLEAFRDQFDVKLEMSSIAPIAIDYYETHPGPYSDVRLAMWNAVLKDAQERDEMEQNIDDKFDEDLWNSAFDG